MLGLYGHCPNRSRTPPLCQTDKRGKKVPQTILASPYTPWQRGKKVFQTILASLYSPPFYGQCPYGNNIFQNRASLSQESLPNNQQFDKLAALSVTFSATCLLFIAGKCFKSENHPIPRIIAKDWDDRASPYHIVSLPPAFHLMPSRQKTDYFK